MSETTPDYVDLLRSFKYRRDIRDPNPESSHLQAFRTGWNRGAGKKAYTTRVLETLTWQNLGNRLGLKLGNASPEEQDVGIVRTPLLLRPRLVIRNLRKSILERPLTDFDLVVWLPNTQAARYLGATTTLATELA